VVTAQHDPFDRVPDALRDALCEDAKVGRPHSGVAAELVHLVGSGLDQHDLIAVTAVLEGRFDDEGVGGAHRRDACGAGLRDGVERMAHPIAFFRIVAHTCSF
jgi:hypothetical protein